MSSFVRRAIRSALDRASRIALLRRRRSDPSSSLVSKITGDLHPVFCPCGRHIPDGAFISFLIIPDDIANAIRDQLASARLEIIDDIPVYLTCVRCAVEDRREIMGQLKNGKVHRVNEGMFELYRARFFGK